MARYFVLLVVVGSTSLIMYVTKPSQVAYFEELQRRADVIESLEHNAYHQMRGVHPIDEMVTAQAPVQLLDQTHHDDYYVFSVFTTAYQTPGYPTRHVRTYGLFSSFISLRAR